MGNQAEARIRRLGHKGVKKIKKYVAIPREKKGISHHVQRSADRGRGNQQHFLFFWHKSQSVDLALLDMARRWRLEDQRK
jgi:hypothetical protein